MKNVEQVVDFLFEVGILSKTPRSGFHFLGSGQQSVSEHITRVMFIGYVLASLQEDVNTGNVLKMCLFHDLPEARTSDLNYVHQKYARADEEKAFTDLTSTLPFGDDMEKIKKEYEARESLEAKLAKDADNIEWILSLKEELDTGNTRASGWIASAVKRLKTENAKKLAEKIVATNSDHWWFADQNDEWWVSRNKEK
ncbi:MAG: HD domain-containing protein [Patescibacteria group bacterium]|jgi:putative hydrolase of HD superfamily